MRIFLDAGHNYAPPDTGATGHGFREEDITFQVADTVRALLELHGVDVRMSRRNLTDILGRTVSESLNLRADGSNRFNADYCVSIHCNAFNGSALGTETFAFRDGSKGAQLARHIHRNLVGLGLRDRGVKFRQDLAMLRLPKAPAVLVELAFIDNANDSDFLKNRQFELAEAVTKGILQQLGIEYRGDYMNFKDTAGHWAEQIINELREMGIVNGDENGNFRPNDTATRAEVATMVRNVVRYVTGE